MKNPAKSNAFLKILGVDPGSLVCGYGVIVSNGREASYVTSGTINAAPCGPLHHRLRHIYESLVAIIREHRPDDIVVEKIFFAKGAKAALSLGHARGVVLLAAASEQLTLHECTALQVKKAVVGYGRAEKRQVQEMVKMILRLRGTISPDGSDALALALCHMNTLQFNNAVDRDVSAGRDGAAK